jgi:hypothetical protein
MPSRPPRAVRRVLPLLVALLFSACAGRLTTGPPAPAPTGPGAGFAVGRDTFAFANVVRAEHPGRAVDFAYYCIVMARGANQFFRFARFAPDAAPVSDADYTRLTRSVMSIGAWEAPRPFEHRVVIPGYPDLYTFSQARESAIKAAFDSNTLSMFHWRNWRVALPLPPGHQRRLARQLTEELAGGRPVPLMITNFPDPDLLNHAVLVFDSRPGARAVEFVAYDPNDPTTPLGLHFDPATGGFWVEPLPYSPPGRIRAFRLYTSPLL